MSTSGPEARRSAGARQTPTIARADLWAGLACLAFGGLILWVGADYPLGRGGRIGPGYAPQLLGSLLIGLGGVLIVRAAWVDEAVELVFRPRPVVLVLGAVLAFALAFAWAGLVPAVLACVVVANWATSENSWRSAIGLGVTLALFSWLLFVVALKLPMPVFRL